MGADPAVLAKVQRAYEVSMRQQEQAQQAYEESTAQASGQLQQLQDKVTTAVERDAAWYAWKFVHNLLVHPFLAFPWEPRWAQRAHDWTAERCLGGG